MKSIHASVRPIIKRRRRRKRFSRPEMIIGEQRNRQKSATRPCCFLLLFLRFTRSVIIINRSINDLSIITTILSLISSLNNLPCISPPALIAAVCSLSRKRKRVRPRIRRHLRKKLGLRKRRRRRKKWRRKNLQRR